MGAYNRSTYIRATAAKLAREAASDVDVICEASGTLWIDLAMAQALAMDQPYLADSYMQSARRTMRNVQAAAALRQYPDER